MSAVLEHNLKKTPLHAQHNHLQAKMVPFGGWSMPLQYEGILAEYDHTRQHVSVFDTSHMGEFLIHGPARETGLERIVTQPLTSMPCHIGRYGMMCNEAGGVIDDLIVFRLEEERWMLVVNAGTTEGDAAHIQKHLDPSAGFEDISSETGKLDVQGPAARDILRKLVPGIDELRYFSFSYYDVLGCRAMVSRTGYTGELGYEIFYPWKNMASLWDWLLAQGVHPAGLGVRDVLRLEMGYSLYGHELNAEITPLEAGLTRFIDWDKDFIGREGLLQQKEKGISRRQVGLISCSRRSPRAGHGLNDSQGRRIGTVTSGSFSPGVNKGIGLALIEDDFRPEDQQNTIMVGDGTNGFAADLSRPPFYKQGTLKK